jgi:hypothetical protein
MIDDFTLEWLILVGFASLALVYCLPRLPDRARPR